MFGSRLIEIVAAMLGFVNVGLIIRRSIWNYPFGIVMVVLYGIVFWQYRLYAEAALQVYFLVIQIFGWVWWYRGRGDDGLILVTRAPTREITTCVFVALLTALALGSMLDHWTSADAPYWDATIAALSVVAQFLLARRRLESWLVWMIVDVLAIGLYISRDLFPTAALYSLFLIMATIGLFTWTQAWRKDEAIA